MDEYDLVIEDDGNVYMMIWKFMCVLRHVQHHQEQHGLSHRTWNRRNLHGRPTLHTDAHHRNKNWPRPTLKRNLILFQQKKRKGHPNLHRTPKNIQGFRHAFLLDVRLNSTKTILTNMEKWRPQHGRLIHQASSVVASQSGAIQIHVQSMHRCATRTKFNGATRLTISVGGCVTSPGTHNRHARGKY